MTLNMPERNDLSREGSLQMFSLKTDYVANWPWGSTCPVLKIATYFNQDHGLCLRYADYMTGRPHVKHDPEMETLSRSARGWLAGVAYRWKRGLN